MRAPILNYGNPINRQHPLMRGLVSRWKAWPQRTGGMTYWDAFGRSHGAATAAPAWSGLGALIGTSQSFNCGSIPAINSAAFSFGGWAYKTASNQIWVLGMVGASATNYLTWFSDGALYGDIATNVPTFSIGGSGLRFLFKTWDGTTNTLYVDGIAKASSGTAATVPTGGAFHINRGSSVFGTCVHGEVITFSRALLASEVLQFYNASRQQYDPTLNWIRRRSRNAAAAGGTAFPWHYYQQMMAG